MLPEKERSRSISGHPPRKGYRLAQKRSPRKGYRLAQKRSPRRGYRLAQKGSSRKGVSVCAEAADIQRAARRRQKASREGGRKRRGDAAALSACKVTRFFDRTRLRFAQTRGVRVHRRPFTKQGAPPAHRGALSTPFCRAESRSPRRNSRRSCTGRSA